MTKADPKDFLANERTFLAWIRTSIGLMAFGFVLERFALILRQFSFFLGKSELTEHALKQQGVSSGFGILLVEIGALMALFAYVDYRKTRQQLLKGDYNPARPLPLITMGFVVLLGVVLVLYLLYT